MRLLYLFHTLVIKADFTYANKEHSYKREFDIRISV